MGFVAGGFCSYECGSLGVLDRRLPSGGSSSYGECLSKLWHYKFSQRRKQFSVGVYILSGGRLVSSNMSSHPSNGGLFMPILPYSFSGSAGICDVSALDQRNLVWPEPTVIQQLTASPSLDANSC